ncbi:MAG: hypothetical protein JO168_23070 [Solirubrobacterales bacterium]|nr:hypothetical protein [Solirubrobacterales bacterium]
MKLDAFARRGRLAVDDEHARATLLDDLITRRGLRADLDAEVGLAGGADAQSVVAAYFGILQQVV